jgi:hypothetical protein
MRQLLVKLFVLDYKFRLFNLTYNAPRASRIIYPVMVITGLQVALNPNYPTPDIYLWISYFVTALALFFGFVYFKIKPAKWVELDNDQKRQYGYFSSATLTDIQYKEWLKIVHNYNKNKK